MALELEDFAHAIMTSGRPMATLEEAMESIALIEWCYNNQQPLDFPWMQPVRT